MKSIALDKYVKTSVKKMDNIATTVSIRKEQKAFVEETGLNLSSMVRDMLSGIMAAKGKRAAYCSQCDKAYPNGVCLKGHGKKAG